MGDLKENKRLTPFHDDFRENIKINFFVAAGYFILIFSPIGTLLISLAQIIGYIIIDTISMFLEKPMNLPFLPFIFGFILRTQAFFIVLSFMIILYGYFWGLLFYIGYLSNQGIIKYFSHLYGRNWNDLIKNIYRGSEVSIYLNVVSFAFISLIIQNKDIYDRFYVLLFMLTSPVLVYFIYILFCNRRLGNWAFYQIKKIIIPYIFIIILATFFSIYLMPYVFFLSYIFGFIPEFNDIQFTEKVIYILRDQKVEFPKMSFSQIFDEANLFNISFLGAIEILIMSTMIVLFAVWIISIVIRKDYTQLILFFALIASSLFSEKIYLFYVGILELFPIQINLHPFLVIILFSFLIDQLFGKIKELFIKSIACKKCGLGLKKTELFCPNCGLKNLKAEK